MHVNIFRMTFEDWANNFTNLDICHFVNTSIISIKKSWNESIFHSKWTVSGRNGGGTYESATFLSNPQVRGTIMSNIQVLDTCRIISNTQTRDSIINKPQIWEAL